MQNLESNFYANGGEFREFTLESLFECIRPKKHPFTKSDLAKVPNEFYNLPTITSTSSNQGISCYMPRDVVDKKHILKNVISVAANGNAPIFYQPYEFSILQDAYALRFKKKDLNSYCYLYLTSLIQKILVKYNWNDKSGWNKVKHEKVSLPTIKEQIAFDFMETYIKELKYDRLKKLNEYLEIAELKDHTLTESEVSAIKIFNTLNFKATSNGDESKSRLDSISTGSIILEPSSMKWKEFKLNELFEVKSNASKHLNKDNFIFNENAEYPYFTRTIYNNGILGYVEYLDEKHKIKGNSIAVGLISMQFFYMDRDFYTGQFTNTIYPKFDNFNEKIALYFIALLNRNAPRFLAFLVRDFEKVFNETSIILPVDRNGHIVFEFMQVFIKAIQKEVAKNMVLYNDKKLGAYTLSTR